MDKKNYPGKLAESNIVYIPITITNPKIPVEDANSKIYEYSTKNFDQIRIPVIFDYTDFTPTYNNKNDWWYFDKKNNTTHVLIEDNLRSEFIELMRKKEKGENLTKEEKDKLKTYEAIINTLPHVAAEKAMENYTTYFYEAMSPSMVAEDPTPYGSDISKEKREYRTKKNAGTVDEIPAQVPAITNKSYQNAMTLNMDNKAYLQPLSSTDNLVYENGQLLFEGFPATAATLKRYYTSDGIENFDLPLLRVFYAIILNRFAKTWQEDKSIEDVVTLYYPDLAKMLGKSLNINQENINSCINSILSFQTIMGIIDKGKKGNDILPVLVYMGNDVEKNTISFASPYMVRVIRDIYNASIRKSKTGTPILKKNGTPQMLPSYSYMIKSSIAKEKNKKAVEIVFIIVSLIEQCGNNEPHIKASTIIERNQPLKQAINKCKTQGNINNLLTRAFSKAWELLNTHTTLKEHYIDIQLPDITAKDFKALWIPTSSSLDKVFSFKHNGKIKK